MKPRIWDPWSMAAASPKRLAVIADGDVCTFGALTARADRLGRGLRALGVADGAIISTDIPAGSMFFALALAALKYGFGLLPMGRRQLTDDIGLAVPARVGACLHVGALSVAGLSTVPVMDVAAAGEAEAVAGSVTERPRSGYFVYLTSGTTGSPTPVVRARPWYPYKGVAVHPRYAAGPSSGPHVMSNPTFHLGTLGPAMYALQAGSGVVVQRPWSPEAFVNLLDQHHADSAFVSADRLVELVNQGRWSAHRPSAVFHGGAACTMFVKRRAIALMGSVLHEYYGTSAGIISEISTTEWLQRPGSVGRPMSGVEVEIHADGAPQPAGELGEIVVRLRAIDRTAGGAGVVHTGDLGFRDSAGFLYVVGRLTGVDNWRHARLEYAIQRLPEVTDCVVLPEGSGAASESVICCVESVAPSTAGAAQRIRAMAGEFGISELVVDVRTPGHFPRTPSGKMQRRLLSDAAPATSEGGRS